MNRESADADRVNTALDVLAAGDLDTAVPILLDVIKNTPSGYSIFEELCHLRQEDSGRGNCST